ncbi:MAG: hypothetical protein GY859_22960, partial [Desulfobacterales bacterium]|nr:hypothetical protein [Desulfobacterales bacterium]
PFPTLVHHWLRAAGASVGNISPAWCLAEVAEGPPFRLPIMLIHEPFAAMTGLKDALDAIRKQVILEKRIIIVTEGEALAPEAWERLAVLQDEYVIIHITGDEVRGAFREGDSSCRALLDGALQPV